MQFGDGNVNICWWKCQYFVIELKFLWWKYPQARGLCLLRPQADLHTKSPCQWPPLLLRSFKIKIFLLRLDTFLWGIHIFLLKLYIFLLKNKHMSIEAAGWPAYKIPPPSSLPMATPSFKIKHISCKNKHTSFKIKHISFKVKHISFKIEHISFTEHFI